MTEPERSADMSGAEAAPSANEHDAAAFYHDPPLWVGSTPVDPTMRTPPDFDAFGKTVFRKKISSGIEIKVSTDGLFAFGFSDWDDGQYPAKQANGMPEFDELARVTLNRTLVMNSFLASLYTNETMHGKFERERMVVTPELLVSLQSLDNGGMGFGNGRVSYLVTR